MPDQAASPVPLVDLRGKIALVPGGSGGIGSGVAGLLAACGADIAIGYGRNAERAEATRTAVRSSGRRARIDPVDATDPDAIEAWVAAVEQDLGPIDILANCVGSSGGFKLLGEQTQADLDHLARLHFWAPIHLSRAVMGGMAARKVGRIIHLSSDGAKVGQSGAAVANAGNAATIAFAKSLARELAGDNVTVNAVCPGPTRTPVLEGLIAGGDTGAKLAESITRAIPLRRIGEPGEVAAVFAFLASDAAGYITGQAISVSGGLTMG